MKTRIIHRFAVGVSVVLLAAACPFALAQERSYVALSRTAADEVRPPVDWERDGNSMDLSIDVPGAYVTTAAEGEDYDQVQVPGCGATGTGVGQPVLPFRGFHVEIPHGVEVDVSVASAELDFLGPGYRIEPMQQEYAESEEPPPFFIDEEAYETDALFPASLVTAGPPMVARGRRLVFVQVWLAQYNPVTTELWAVKSIELEVATRGNPNLEAEARREALRSDGFDGILEPHVINLGDYDRAEVRQIGSGEDAAEEEEHVETPSPGSAAKSIDYPYTDNGENYLIIVSDGSFGGGQNLSSTSLDATENFIEWKKRKGFYVTEVLNSDLASGEGESLTAGDIRRFIQDCYDGTATAGVYPANRPPAYVLLIGDDGQIPAVQYKVGTATDCEGEWEGEGACVCHVGYHVLPTDTLFACVDDDDDGLAAESCYGDFFPDLAIGRIAAERQSECELALNNIMRYEIDPSDGDPNTPYAWLRRILSVAKLEDDNRDGVLEKKFLETSVFLWYYCATQLGWQTATAWQALTALDPTRYEAGAAGHTQYFRDFLIEEGLMGSGPYTIPPSITNRIIEKVGDDMQAGTEAIENALEGNGAGLVTYRDHGWWTMWSGPLLTVGNLVDDSEGEPVFIDNGLRTPVVLSLCCWTGEFDNANGNCFAEAWMERSFGTADNADENGGGAVGVVAASDVSGVGNRNDYLAHGIMTAIWPCYDQAYTGDECYAEGEYAGEKNDGTYNSYATSMGEALIFGKYYAVMWKGLEAGEYPMPSVKNFIHFNYFGDPAMRLRVSTPSALAASYSTALVAERDDVAVVSVTVTLDGTSTAVAGAQVSVTHPGLATPWWGLTDANGQIDLEVDLSALDTDAPSVEDLQLVVTTGDHLPYGVSWDDQGPDIGPEYTAPLTIARVPSPCIVFEKDGELLATINAEGNVDLRGTAIETTGIGEGEIEGEAANGPSWCIHDSGGNIVAMIDEYGNLFAKSINDEQSSLSMPGGSCFVVTDENDSVSLYIEADGDLYTEGIVSDGGGEGEGEW